MRSVPLWKGKTDDAKPTRAVLIRLFQAANGFCAQCGIKVGPKGWHADHIKRLKDGGENGEDNLQVLCIQCHREKTKLENIGQAKANRVIARHIGIRKPSRLREMWQWKKRVLAERRRRESEET